MNLVQIINIRIVIDNTNVKVGVIKTFYYVKRTDFTIRHFASLNSQVPLCVARQTGLAKNSLMPPSRLLSAKREHRTSEFILLNLKYKMTHGRHNRWFQNLKERTV